VSNVNRKHPVSIAVSMALLAAAASAMASEGTDAPAENGGAQQDAPTTSSPDAKAKSKGAEADEAELTTIIVTGVRASQIRAIELKRLAPSIQDSISAESIGQLPDVTITDALQRITGVQINRDAGVGTSVVQVVPWKSPDGTNNNYLDIEGFEKKAVRQPSSATYTPASSSGGLVEGTVVPPI